MKYIKIIQTFIIFILVVTGCNDSQYPDDVWDPNEVPNSDPEIHNVLPADSAFAGADVVYINGENFGQSIDDILVYFNSELGDIISADDTLILVSPPAIISDSVTIKVSVKGAFLFGEYHEYKLISRMVQYGAFDSIEESVWGLAVDTLENVFAGLTGSGTSEGTIEKLLPPNGERSEENIQAALNTMRSMRVGPDNYIYYVDGANPYVIKSEIGGSGLSYAGLPGVVTDLDFDSNHILYTGGGGQAIYSLNKDLSILSTSNYTDISILAIKTFENNLYVAGYYVGDDESIPIVAMYRNEILDENGTLGEKEIVFDWRILSGTIGNITSIVFDETGTMYIGSDTDYGIMTYSDGILNPYYEKVIFAPISKMSWGNGQYLYLNFRGGKRMINRFDTRINGAPYGGRE
ncbi:MAG: IPT/TIG domain-containing protein [Candidatus Marinimicrobia bacterium]|nr:IPT/TIG domain-containing protein [Candidatus Neomarinimicrobiota bacterium]